MMVTGHVAGNDNRNMALKRLFGIFCCLVVLFTLTFSEDTKESKEMYRIQRTSEKVKIDGHLDEKSWQMANKIVLDNEILPGDNIKPPVPTECYLLYDDKYLYVGFRAFDPHPGQIRAHLSDRDSALQDDVVAILLDTFNDKNRAFAFFCNPLGVQIDQIFSDGGSSEDSAWDAIWKSEGHIGDKGYEVEVAIPFKELQFQGTLKNQVWGFSVLRIYPRNQRHQITNFILNRNNSCLLCQFPRLTGIEGVKPGKNIELDPTITAFRTDDRNSFPDGPMEKEDSRVDIGFSGRWGMTPNLSLSATINPDFSQVEADAAQLDINTQFALFYPEKRPFFLEGLDFFATRIQAVYTRTLADPIWGVKLSGKEGSNAIGFFVARDASTNLLFPGPQGSYKTTLDQGSTATVLRYRKDIGGSSTIGLLLTSREGDDYYNRLGGIDGLIRLGESDTLRFQFLGSLSQYPLDTARAWRQDEGLIKGYAINASYRRKTKYYGYRAIYVDFSPGFRADLGFVPQVDYRKLIIGGHLIFWGKKDAFLSRTTLRADLDESRDHQGNLLEREAEMSLELEMPWQAYLKLKGVLKRKVYSGFSFDQSYIDGYFEIQPTGDFMFNMTGYYGDSIDYEHARPGRELSLQPAVRYLFGRHLSLDAIYLYSRLKVEQGELYKAHLVQGRIVYHINKRLFLRGVIQYLDQKLNTDLYANPYVEPEEKYILTQFLFSYKLNPRTVLFLGYSDNRYGYIDIPLTRKNRTVFLKIGYALKL